MRTIPPPAITPASRPLARFAAQVRELVNPLKKLEPEDILAALAAARGCRTPAECAQFGATAPQLTNPFPHIPGSERALERLRQAVAQKEKVVILGDYDVDGVISSVLLFEVVSRAGNRPACFIPDRIQDDYGVTEKAVGKCLEEHNPTLIVSVDCGSTSTGVIAGLKEKGVDFIVIDHHDPGAARGEGHPSLAHLNPKAWPGVSPLVDEAATLCAGGLVFFFAEYLANNLGAPGWSRDRALALAGMATVADVMPLTRTNRSLVKNSLRLVTPDGAGEELVPGIAALMQKVAAPAFTARAYGWVIGPHLNAAGRVTHARTAANLVACRDARSSKIAAAVDELVATNRERKAIQEKVQEACIEDAKRQLALDPKRRFIVVFVEDAHPGVVGIVAGRLRETFGLPTIVCGPHPEEGYWKGSGRGVKGGNLGEIVHAAVDAGLLLGGGGHAMAAGVRVARGKEEAFREWLETHCASMVWDTVIQLDYVGDYSHLSKYAWAELLERGGPYGNDNPEPVMMVRGAVFAGELKPLLSGERTFGLGFKVQEVGSGKEYRLSWIGLSAEDELVAAEAMLRRGEPLNFPVRQVTRESRGTTYHNLDVAGMPFPVNWR